MKRPLMLLTLILLVLTSCQKKMVNKPTDPASEKVAINKTMDDYHAATTAGNPQLLSSYWTNDLLYCGTDPKEFWDKTGASKAFAEMNSNGTLKNDYKISTREIRIDKDGQSALVLEQITFKEFSEKIPFRLIFHLVRVDNKWRFDFISAGLIPTNDDLIKLNTALK